MGCCCCGDGGGGGGGGGGFVVVGWLVFCNASDLDRRETHFY